ncbi:MAG: trypsin-like peptidase domain-containing protein [Thermoguttaceae bacterium]|jgi:S1-C subfamily serine protease
MERFIAAGWLTVLALLGLAASAPGQEPASDLQMAAAMEKVLVDAIARSEKSVVAIARVRKETPGEALHIEFHPDAFNRPPVLPSVPQPADPNFIPNEYGTGVVVDRGGLILTAYHVLGEDSEYFVTTHDRKTFRAWIKAADPRSDLAVLSIDAGTGGVGASDFSPIALGDAAGLKKGQIIITLGNPYAIARDGQVSAAWGIVANLARKAPPTPDDSDPSGKKTMHHFGTLIQTDAKLNLGTSGGPLLNLKGEMIGLCVSLAATAGYESSAGYAIPVDATFRRVLDVLKQGREVEYGFLGIGPTNLQPQEVLAGLQGMRVERVVPGTPAARDGGLLKSDDIITAVDETPIYDSDGLVLEVGKLPVEAVSRLSVLRGGQKRIVEVKLSKYPVRGTKIVSTRPPAWRGMRTDYPTALVDNDPLGRAAPIFYEDAVVVSEVEEGTPAWRAGVRRGMLIGQVQGIPVRTPKEFQTAVAGKSGAVELRLVLGEPNQVLTVPPGS